MTDELKKNRLAAKPIPNKERVFVEYYLKTWNATDSARRAGYQGNDNVLGVTAHRLLKKAKVRELIDAQLKQHQLSADEVLARLATMAKADLSPFIDETGDVNLTSEQAKQNIYLVRRYKNKSGLTKSGEPFTEKSIEIHDQKDALIQIGRHYKLFTDNVSIDDSQFKKYQAALNKFLENDSSKGESNDENKSET